MSATLTTTLQPIPYLSFDGNCAEAMRHYENVFGGKIKSITSYGDSPFADQMPPECADKIMNAQLELPGGGLLYAGDCPPHVQSNGIHGVGLALNFGDVDEAEKIFDRLAEGGGVTMPFAPTFWAEKFGMVSDKFGVEWLINGVLLNG